VSTGAAEHEDEAEQVNESETQQWGQGKTRLPQAMSNKKKKKNTQKKKKTQRKNKN
jgi:hypothetical protein